MSSDKADDIEPRDIGEAQQEYMSIMDSLDRSPERDTALIRNLIAITEHYGEHQEDLPDDGIELIYSSVDKLTANARIELVSQLAEHHPELL